MRLLTLSLLTLLIVFPARAQEGFPLPPLEVITPENAAEIVQLARIGNGVIYAMAWSPDGVTLGIASSLGVWLYNTDQPDAPPRLFEGQSGAHSIAFNPNGPFIASGGADGSVWIWDIASGETVARLDGHLYTISALTFSSDGALLASGDNSGVVRVWEWANNRTISTFSPSPSSSNILDLVFNHDDTLMGVLFFDGSSWTVEPNSGQPIERSLLADYDDAPGEIAFADDGQTLVIAAYQDEIEYPPVDLDAFYGVAHQLVFSSAEPLLLIHFEGIPSLIQVRDMHTGTLILERPARAGGGNASTSFSPDGRLIASGGDTGTIDIFEADSFETYARLFGHRRGVNSVAFSPEGALVASAGLDNLVGVWDIRAGGEIAPLILLEGHTRGVTAVAFSGDGTLIASGSYDGTIRLWGVPKNS
jgi:WD40 repeat protein